MHKSLFYLSLVAFFCTAVVVVLGAYTRLADAGLGCPDWPTCYGHFWVPNSAEEIDLANQRFAETPVEHHKTWPEQIHRIFASLLGLMILALFVLVMRAQSNPATYRSISISLVVLVAGVIARAVLGDTLDWLVLGLTLAYFFNLLRIQQVPTAAAIDPPPIKLIAVLAGLVILQGLFGMWTVTLKLWPQVVTVHLLGGFTTLSLVWLLVQRSKPYYWRLPADTVEALIPLRLLAAIALCIVAGQIFLGGWTTSNYAALACGDFPKCHASWWPTADFIQGFNLFQHVGPNYLGGQLDNDARTAIHLAHRIGALVSTGVILWLVACLLKVKHQRATRFAGTLVLIVAFQLGLGVSNVVFGLPLAVAVAHNAGGALLLVALITLNHRLHTLRTT